MSLIQRADELHHNPGCTRPDVIDVTGREAGDPGLLCRRCRALWFPRSRLLEQSPTTEDGGAPEQAIPRPATASLDRRLRDLSGGDGSDRRQAERNGSTWPTHKARRRNARKRAQRRAERHEARSDR